MVSKDNVRVCVKFSKVELDQIEEYRKEYDLPSLSQAVRLLSLAGLICHVANQDNEDES